MEAGLYARTTHSLSNSTNTILMMKPWFNIIKQSTQPRREKGGQREREREDPSPSQKHTNPKGVTKAQRSKNYVPKPPPIARSKKHIK
jgi:hypothetical protein